MSVEAKKNGSVRFTFNSENPAKKVFVAGSFNGWDPLPMRKQKNGQYVRNMELPKGIHEYKFIIDDVWQHDLDNEACLLNPMGTFNSIVLVG